MDFDNFINSIINNTINFVFKIFPICSHSKSFFANIKKIFKTLNSILLQFQYHLHLSTVPPTSFHKV